MNREVARKILLAIDALKREVRAARGDTSVMAWQKIHERTDAQLRDLEHLIDN